MTQEIPNILCLDSKGFDDHLEGLSEILRACVYDGASVGFVLPFTLEDSRAFWITKVRPSVVSGDTVFIVVKVGDAVAGTVQLCCGTMPNQVHRAEVSKLLVSPAFRKRGIAKTLMAELEKQARDRDRNLITLDTRTGDNAEPLYKFLGYKAAGVIPGFCRDASDEDRYDPTTYMYKRL